MLEASGKDRSAYAEFDICGKVNNTVLGSSLAEDIRRLNNALFTLHSAHERVGEASTGLGHRKGGRASSILGLDNFITTKLNTLGQSFNFLLGEGETGLFVISQGC
jgi:hypothetical protein